ncbi:UvrABC system protein A, partial [Daphnia magna]
RRGPQLFEPGPQRRHLVGRRVTTHPPGQPDWLGPYWRDVCAGRAQHRSAPARQRPPDWHTATPARHRQQCAGGRARRRHDPRGRPRHRHGAGRGRARRARDGARHLCRHLGCPRLGHGPVHVGPQEDRDSETPQSGQGLHRDHWGQWQQPEKRECEIPRRAADLRDRGVGLRQ